MCSGTPHNHGGNSCTSSREHVKIARQSSYSEVDASNDLEKGRSNRHVRFRVSGMTCPGCAKKVTNALHRIDSVTNSRVNYVASTVDIDITDDSRSNIRKLMSRLERETGFQCYKVDHDLHHLDMLMSFGLVRSILENLPSGIENIECVRETRYRVAYNPVLVGARTVQALCQPGILAPPMKDGNLEHTKHALRRLIWNTALAAALTVPIVIFAWSSRVKASLHYQTRAISMLCLATAVQVLAIPEFYAKALKALIFSRVIEMDMMVVISITAAYGYSLVAFALASAGHELQQPGFFETSSLLITLVLLGRSIAMYARHKALDSISLHSLQSHRAILEDAEGKISDIDARLLEFGDHIFVPPHSRIVTDGKIISGTGSVDESMLTGESAPVPKRPGNKVIAGTMNEGTQFRIQVTRLPGENSISDISELVEDALDMKPRAQEVADRLAGFFVPVIFSIAIIVFIIWLAVALRVRNKDFGGGFGLAITYAIAVLAISCPCALGLAVPMVLVIARGVGVRTGVVIKDTRALEQAHKVTDVVFDKTGTLTEGTLKVVYEEYNKVVLPIYETVALIKGLVQNNPHPVSQAVSAHLQPKEPSPVQLEEVESILGFGLQGRYKSSTLKAGSSDSVSLQSRFQLKQQMPANLTTFAVTIDHKPLAVFGLESSIRQEASTVISALQGRGIGVYILSGDNRLAVSAVAQRLSIPDDKVRSRCLPADKKAFITSLTRRPNRTVMFVGDGTNDAPSLAAAHVGCQIGNTSDITRATADVILTGGLEGVIRVLEISKQAWVRIVMNFVWSAVYNTVAILLAAGAFVSVRIRPEWAGLGEAVSVLPVIAVAMSLRWWNGGKVTG